MRIQTIKHLLKSLLWSLIPLLYSPFVFAADASGDLWTRFAEDKSIEYLGNIFGIVGTALAGQGDDSLAQIFKIFNVIVLSLGTIVVVYTVFASVINTAQEGEVMGRKWSSMWLPFRSAAGLSILLPTASGYSLVQILMMTIILKGVDAGNAVYRVILDRAKQGKSIAQEVQVDKAALTTQSVNFVKLALCMEELNTTTFQPFIGNQPVTAYRQGDSVWVGVQGVANFAHICGKIEPSAVASPADSTQWGTYQAQAALAGMAMADSLVREAVVTADPNQWSNQGVQLQIARAISSVIKSAPLVVTKEDYKSAIRTAKLAGWIFAGSNYFRILSPPGASSFKPTPPAVSFDEKTINGLITTTSNLPFCCEDKTTDIGALTVKYLGVTDNYLNSSSTGTSISNQPTTLSGQASDFMNQIGIMQSISDLAFNFMNTLTTGEGDPLSSMRTVGTDLMLGIETAFWIMLVVCVLLGLGLCVLAGINPLCSVFMIFMSIIMPLFALAMALLWGAGVLLGIYVPLIPYLVFTFSALAWLLMVIEAVIAAPIVALGLVSPSAEHLGRASPAVMLIANIFLRPTLMVIGLVVAARLYQAAINMFNYAFSTTIASINQTATGYGIFGTIALVVIYGGIVIAITHECFTLIYVIPDKIGRWIGGHAEQSSVAKSMGEIQKTVDTASKTSQQMMQGGVQFMEKTVQMAKEKQSGGGGGGMPGGGGGGGGGMMPGGKGGAAPPGKK